MVRNLLKAQLYAQMMSYTLITKAVGCRSHPYLYYGKYLAATLEKLCLDTEFKYCEAVIGDDWRMALSRLLPNMKQHPNI